MFFLDRNLYPSNPRYNFNDCKLLGALSGNRNALVPHNFHLSKDPFSHVVAEKTTRIKCFRPNFVKKKGFVPIFLCFKCFN